MLILSKIQNAFTGLLRQHLAQAYWLNWNKISDSRGSLIVEKTEGCAFLNVREVKAALMGRFVILIGLAQYMAHYDFI